MISIQFHKRTEPQPAEFTQPVANQNSETRLVSIVAWLQIKARATIQCIPVIHRVIAAFFHPAGEVIFHAIEYGLGHAKIGLSVPE